MAEIELSNFESEETLAFLEAIRASGKMVIVDTIKRLYADATFYSTQEANFGLLAAEMYCANLGKPSPDFPHEWRRWVIEENPLQISVMGKIMGVPQKYIELARIIVKRILESSELAMQMKEEGTYAAWCDIQLDLLNRLKF
jgi:hypothetical protein